MSHKLIEGLNAMKHRPDNIYSQTRFGMLAAWKSSAGENIAAFLFQYCTIYPGG